MFICRGAGGTLVLQSERVPHPCPSAHIKESGKRPPGDGGAVPYFFKPFCACVLVWRSVGAFPARRKFSFVFIYTISGGVVGAPGGGLSPGLVDLCRPYLEKLFAVREDLLLLSWLGHLPEGG